jgi:hypothetical protein
VACVSEPPVRHPRSYDEPESSVVIAEALHAIIGRRRRGEPMTVEAEPEAPPGGHYGEAEAE